MRACLGCAYAGNPQPNAVRHVIPGPNRTFRVFLPAAYSNPEYLGHGSFAVVLSCTTREGKPIGVRSVIQKPGRHVKDTSVKQTAEVIGCLDSCMRRVAEMSEELLEALDTTPEALDPQLPQLRGLLDVHGVLQLSRLGEFAQKRDKLSAWRSTAKRVSESVSRRWSTIKSGSLRSPQRSDKQRSDFRGSDARGSEHKRSHVSSGASDRRGPASEKREDPATHLVTALLGRLDSEAAQHSGAGGSAVKPATEQEQFVVKPQPRAYKLVRRSRTPADMLIVAREMLYLLTRRLREARLHVFNFDDDLNCMAMELGAPIDPLLTGIHAPEGAATTRACVLATLRGATGGAPESRRHRSVLEAHQLNRTLACVVQLARGFLQSICYFHVVGLAHHDIKLSNAMLFPAANSPLRVSGHPVVCKLVDVDGAVRADREASVVFTPTATSPELASDIARKSKVLVRLSHDDFAAACALNRVLFGEGAARRHLKTMVKQFGVRAVFRSLTAQREGFASMHTAGFPFLLDAQLPPVPPVPHAPGRPSAREEAMPKADSSVESPALAARRLSSASCNSGGVPRLASPTVTEQRPPSLLRMQPQTSARPPANRLAADAADTGVSQHLPAADASHVSLVDAPLASPLADELQRPHLRAWRALPAPSASATEAPPLALFCSCFGGAKESTMHKHLAVLLAQQPDGPPPVQSTGASRLRRRLAVEGVVSNDSLLPSGASGTTHALDARATLGTNAVAAHGSPKAPSRASAAWRLGTQEIAAVQLQVFAFLTRLVREGLRAEPSERLTVLEMLSLLPRIERAVELSAEELRG